MNLAAAAKAFERRSRFWDFFAWSLAFGRHLMQAALHFYLSIDYHTMAANALGLLRNGELGVPMVKAETLSYAYTHLSPNWPPGFSVALAGAFAVFGESRMAFLGIFAAGLALFFLSMYALARMIEEETGGPLTLTLGLFWVFAPAPLGLHSAHHIADVVTVGFYLASAALLFHPGLSRVSRGFPAAVFSALFMSVAVTMRFAYWHLIWVPAMALYLFGAPGRNTIQRALLQVLISGALLFSLWLWIRFHMPSFFSERFGMPSALQWKRLFSVPPFFWEPLANEWPITSIVSILWERNFLGFRVMRLREAIGITSTVAPLLTAAVYVGGLAAVWQAAQRTGRLPRTALISATGAMTLGVTLIFLGGMSLVQTMEGGWSYLSERRYFIPAMSFITLQVWTLVFLMGPRLGRALNMLGRVAVILIFIGTVSVCTVFLKWPKQAARFDAHTPLRYLAEDGGQTGDSLARVPVDVPVVYVEPWPPNYARITTASMEGRTVTYSADPYGMGSVETVRVVAPVSILLNQAGQDHWLAYFRAHKAQPVGPSYGDELYTFVLPGYGL